MAKINSLFKYDGTFQNVTVVKSKTYGNHIRAARGTHKKATLNDAMKQSGEMTKIANLFAKEIKDVFEPYWKDFKDGTLWYRLVSFVKLQFRDNDGVDLHGLEEFEFYKRYPLYYLFASNVKATISPKRERILDIAVQSRCKLKLNRDKADSYQQTLIVAFFNEDFEAMALSESVVFPLVSEKRNEQRASFPIPDEVTSAVIALKGDFFEKGKSVNRVTRKGMQVVKVVDVER